MFGVKQSKKANPEPTLPAKETAARFQHPKVLAIDVDTDVVSRLQSEGYNAISGTFGTPYKVPKSAIFYPVIAHYDLPNYAEQEIVIIDLVCRQVEPNPSGEKMAPLEELDWWVKGSLGIIDPRPRVMASVQEKLDRIHENGGVFIVFADELYQQELILGSRQRTFNGFIESREIYYNNWSFLSLFELLTISSDHGEEMRPLDNDWPITEILREYIGNSSFCCTFKCNYHLEDRWIPLLTNKYGATVAGAIAPRADTEDGLVFILPRIQRQGDFLASFLKNILPELRPNLFPDAEGQKWVHYPEYELPSVLEKQKHISIVENEASAKIAELEQSIAADQSENEFFYSLIRETGDALVGAVKHALELIGFESIVDVDEEMKNADEANTLREDLRIHDTSPTLVIDIKGIGGLPSDSEAMQANKHANIRIQEEKRIDFQGLMIINHQRLIPPLDRNNTMPYRKEILDNAMQSRFGLLTGWDLFRLVRNFQLNKWTPEHVKPLFYEIGRIVPIPMHYELIGVVKQVWQKAGAFSVSIEEGELHVGDRLSIEFPVDFNEHDIKSLMLNDEPIESACVGSEVGVALDESLPNVKVGMNVYRINA